MSADVEETHAAASRSEMVSADVASEAARCGLARGVTRTTIGMLVPAFATWLVSCLVVLPLALAAGAVVGGTVYTPLLVMLVWTLSAGVMFVRRIEEVVGNLFYCLRHPTEAEMARLSAAWNDVCAAARVDPQKYVLRVQEIDAINAFAGGGHVVAVTTPALMLEDAQLRGVLAHELGHHLELHPVPLMLTFWYGIPVRVADVVMVGLARVSELLSELHGALALLAWFALMPLLIARLYIGVITSAARLVARIFGRFGEYAADRRATDLGFGDGLVSVLERFVEMGADDAYARSGMLSRAFATHPPARKRMRAVQRRLAQLA